VQLVGSVLFGADQIVSEFVKARIPNIKDFGAHTALGVIRQGKLIGGVVYNNYQGFDISANIAFDSSNWAYPATLRTLFGYPFNQLQVARMTAVIAESNKRSRRICEGLGFKLEGVHPRGADGNEAALSFGLMREACRFLRENHG
jgi:RimJ/RimL family protein N-acetyltransferase